jgi:hypothetical protein
LRKWQTLNLSPAKVEIITLLCIALHNFLAKENWESCTEGHEEYQELDKLGKFGEQGSNRSMYRAIH